MSTFGQQVPSWIGIGRSATRAKAPTYLPERSRGFENPLPRTKSPGLAQFNQGWNSLPGLAVLKRCVDHGKISSAIQFAAPIAEPLASGLDTLQKNSCFVSGHDFKSGRKKL